MEHWEPLREGGWSMVYDDDLFRPGTDSFLLSSLPRLKAGMRVCDLGCGTGLLGLLLLQRRGDLFVTGIELQEKAASLARRCGERNGLGERLRIIHDDLRQVRQRFPTGSFDLCICNPPYYPTGSGKEARCDALGDARSERTCTLSDVCAAAEYLLRWGGDFCLVHKPERLTDVLYELRTHHIEPKRLRFVAPTASAPPSLLLIEGRRGGKSGLTLLPPLLLDTPEGRAELDAIYFRKEDPAL